MSVSFRGAGIINTPVTFTVAVSLGQPWRGGMCVKFSFCEHLLVLYALCMKTQLRVSYPLSSSEVAVMSVRHLFKATQVVNSRLETQLSGLTQIPDCSSLTHGSCYLLQWARTG